MTVAEMIAQRTAALRTVLHDSDQAIHYKGGTPADDLSGLPAAIASIPSGGELPVLTNPAAAGDVIAGKEYIDGNGNKKTGTLVVCDTVAVVEAVGSSGVGLEVEIESTADGSTKILTLPETNLLPENIVAGSSIFGVPGTAKTVERITVTTACSVAKEVSNYFLSIAQENENAVFVFAKSLLDDIPNYQTAFVPVHNKVIPGYYIIRYSNGQLNLSMKNSDTNGCVLNVGDVYFKVVLDG